MKALRKVVDTAIDWTLVMMFFVIFVVVLLQILFRYILQSPLVWSEELSRFIFIWVSLMGWTLATRNGTHIAITFFQERLPAPVRTFLGFFFNLCTLVFLAVLAYLGWQISIRTMGRGLVTIPALTQGMLYLSLPVSAVIGILYTIMNIFDPSRGKSGADGSVNAGRDTI